MRAKKSIYFMVIVLVIFFGIGKMSFPQEKMVFNGKLTDNIFTDYYYLRTDQGPVYRLLENDIGIEMIEMVGSRVSIVGTLVETDDGIFLKVFSYKFL